MVPCRKQLFTLVQQCLLLMSGSYFKKNIRTERLVDLTLLFLDETNLMALLSPISQSYPIS